MSLSPQLKERYNFKLIYDSIQFQLISNAVEEMFYMKRKGQFLDNENKSYCVTSRKIEEHNRQLLQMIKSEYFHALKIK